MATSSVTSPVTRETSAYFRSRGMRAIVVTITGSLIELRLKGTRQRETVDVASLFNRAIKERVASEQRAKRAEREARRKSRSAR